MTPAKLSTYHIVERASVFAAEEMGIALRNSAYSPSIKERMDHSCAIFDSQRRLVAQAEHIPVHLGSMAYALENGLRELNEELEAGDQILFNDPYLSGTHLPDLTVIKPIFHSGRLVAFSVNKAHHADVGGRAPGSMAHDSRVLSEEGIVISPCKLVRRGELNTRLLVDLSGQVRTPKVMMGDLRAQISANVTGQRRILELLEKYGERTLQDGFDFGIDRSSQMLAQDLQRMPKKSVVGEDYLEGTGLEEKTIRIRARVTVRADGVKFDYSGSDHQVDGPMNAVLGVTISGVYYVLRCFTNPQTTVNHGFHSLVEISAPEGTIINPIKPAAVAGGNVETSQRNVDALMKAFSRILPRKACAACQGTMNNLTIGTHEWTFYETLAGGFGGRYGLDGEDAIHSHMTNTMNTPIEAIENNYPLRYLDYCLRRDTGGAGQWRGGVGLERTWLFVGDEATLSILAERTRIPPWGLFGGGPGATGRFHLIRKGGRRENLKGKTRVTVRRGDILVAKTPGGGGYGNPFKRSPQSVLKDVLEGLVSARAAREEYGVVIDRARGTVDEEASRQLRSFKTGHSRS